MGKLGRSWELMKTSLGILRKDKEIMIFPVLSFIACAVILLSFFVGFFFLGLPSVDSSLWLWVVLMILIYFVLFFIVIFFNTAIIACANIRLNGGDPTVADGLRIASQNIGRILLWALISATIGMILQAIRERAGWAGKIIAGIIGFAWTYVTFFIIPVLIFEKKESPRPSGEAHPSSSRLGVRLSSEPLGSASSLCYSHFLALFRSCLG